MSPRCEKRCPNSKAPSNPASKCTLHFVGNEGYNMDTSRILILKLIFFHLVANGAFLIFVQVFPPKMFILLQLYFNLAHF